VTSDESPVPRVVRQSMTGSNFPGPMPRIQFAPATRSQKSEVRRVRIGALYFVALGLWGVVLAMTGEPVSGAIAAFVLLEFALAMFGVSRITGQVITDDEVSRRLTPILIDLCSKVDCGIPRVVLRNDSLRGAAVQQRKGNVNLLLSRRLVDATSDAQLRAIVAHEVIHLAHNDLRFAKVRSLVAGLGGAAIGIAIWVASGNELRNLPILLAGMMVAMMLISLLLSPLNRRLEVRADVEGAALGGDAQAVAEALIVAYSISDETRDRLYGRPPWRWLLAPLSWRMPTHPPLDVRIARLSRIG